MDKSKCAKKQCDSLNSTSTFRSVKLQILSHRELIIINLYLSVNILMISFLPTIGRTSVVDCLKSRYGKYDC